MKPSKGINMYQELFLLTLSLERWTQYGWVRLERYFDPTILFMDSLEQATIMQKVTTLKVFILLNYTYGTKTAILFINDKRN